MMRRQCAMATTWPFLLGLVVLLLNDAWGKAAFPGLLTGKLSDFAGVAVVSLLLAAAFPRRRGLVYLAVVSAFTWWKSPWSQAAIEAFNAWGLMQIGRTVDLTDLIAFAVLPGCEAVARNVSAFAVPGATLRRALAAPVLALTALGLMATSSMPVRQHLEARSLPPAPALDRAIVAQVVSEVALSQRLRCMNCDKPGESPWFQGNDLSLTYETPDDRSIRIDVRTSGAPNFVGKSAKEKASLLQDTIKARLTARFPGLQFVERPSEGGR